jgi:hypothetical protein
MSIHERKTLKKKPVSELSETEFTLSPLPPLFLHVISYCIFAKCKAFIHSKEAIFCTIYTSHRCSSKFCNVRDKK